MRHVIENILVRHDPPDGPGRPALPVVVDSPHSGVVDPPDFTHVCPRRLLRDAEDVDVDALVADAPDHGAALLCALFPRSYIDVNRAVDDLDENLIEGEWPGGLAGSDRSRQGMGLIRRSCRPGVPMYDRRLSVAEVQARIDGYYMPYHATLAEMLDAAHARWGKVWYLDCHSMPSVAPLLGGGAERGPADFVLGDRDGTTCDPDFTAFLAETLRGMGYAVRVNDPYKGVELVRRHGRPAEGRHAVQIEVNRGLYIDERTLERHDGFDAVRNAMGRLIAAACAYAADAVAAPATPRVRA